MSDLQPQPVAEFSWSAHPAAERFGHTLLAAVLVLAVAAAVWASFDSLAWGGVALVVLIASLNRFFFPSRFTIDQEGITANYLLVRKRAEWKHLRRFVHDEHGGFLSTRAQHSRLDAYRGLHILFGSHRDEVIHRTRAQIAHQRHAARSMTEPCEVRTVAEAHEAHEGKLTA